MQRNTPFRYVVAQGEEVTLVATPHGCGARVVASLDGETLDVSGPRSTPTFVFTASRPAGERHRVFLRGDFTADDTPQASYAISVSGSAGGGAFSGDSLDRPDPSDPQQFDQMGYQFEVADAVVPRGMRTRGARAQKPKRKRRAKRARG